MGIQHPILNKYSGRVLCQAGLSKLEWESNGDALMSSWQNCSKLYLGSGSVLGQLNQFSGPG